MPWYFPSNPHRVQCHSRIILDECLPKLYRFGIYPRMTLSDWMRRNDKDRDSVAAELGVSVVSVGRYLTGERTPRPEILIKIKSMTQNLVTADDFLSAASERAA